MANLTSLFMSEIMVVPSEINVNQEKQPVSLECDRIADCRSLHDLAFRVIRTAK